MNNPIKYCATTESQEEFVNGGVGATPDEAYIEWEANCRPDEVPAICRRPGEELTVEIWSIREPTEDEMAEGYQWMLDELRETRGYVAAKEDFDELA